MGEEKSEQRPPKEYYHVLLNCLDASLAKYARRGNDVGYEIPYPETARLQRIFKLHTRYVHAKLKTMFEHKGVSQMYNNPTSRETQIH